MLFNLALYTGLFLTFEVLAVPSGLAARPARRREGRQSQINQRLDSNASAGFNARYSENWAGAILNKAPGTFTTVTGTFTVPTPPGTVIGEASIWVGIDGDSCIESVFQTGIALTVDSSGAVTYQAWYEWLPELSTDFNDITLSAGDVIRATVWAYSPTSGTAQLENLSNGQTVSIDLMSSAALCQQDAEWIVEDPEDEYGNLVPFTDFDAVTFTNAVAGSQDAAYTPGSATIVDIKQNGHVMTYVANSGSTVAISYLPIE